MSDFANFNSAVEVIRKEVSLDEQRYTDEAHKAYASGDLEKVKAYLSYAAHASIFLEDFTDLVSRWKGFRTEIELRRCQQAASASSAAQSKKKKPRAKNTRFAVRLPDARMVKEASCAKTFARVIELIYPQEVARLGLKVAGVDLVTQNPSTKVKRNRIALENGWFVTTHSSTEDKRKCLLEIGRRLHINFEIIALP